MALQSPNVHPKAPATGKGVVNLAPPAMGVLGPSNATPVTAHGPAGSASGSGTGTGHGHGNGNGNNGQGNGQG